MWNLLLVGVCYLFAYPWWNLLNVKMGKKDVKQFSNHSKGHVYNNDKKTQLGIMACWVGLPEFVSHGHPSSEVFEGFWWWPPMHVCIWTTNSEAAKREKHVSLSGVCPAHVCVYVRERRMVFTWHMPSPAVEPRTHFHMCYVLTTTACWLLADNHQWLHLPTFQTSRTETDAR